MTIENCKPMVRRVGTAIFTKCIRCNIKITIDVDKSENPDIVTCPACGVVFDRIEKKEIENNEG